MTKKDYIAIAEAFILVKPYTTNTTLTAQEVYVRLAKNIANVLARDNSRFDRERFLAAAGVNNNE